MHVDFADRSLRLMTVDAWKPASSVDQFYKKGRFIPDPAFDFHCILQFLIIPNAPSPKTKAGVMNPGFLASRGGWIVGYLRRGSFCGLYPVFYHFRFLKILSNIFRNPFPGTEASNSFNQCLIYDRSIPGFFRIRVLTSSRSLGLPANIL